MTHPYDIEITRELRNEIDWETATSLVLTLLLGVLLFNTHWGDPLIYLSHVKHVTFSGAITSPIWYVISLLTFGNPFMFKVLSILIALIAVNAFLNRVENKLIVFCLLSPFIIFGVMGYETLLALLFVAHWERLGMFLPLVRLESYPMMIWQYRKNHRALIMLSLIVLVWYVVVYLFFGSASSVESRVFRPHYRYLAVYWFFFLLWIDKYLTKHNFFLLFFVAWLPFKIFQIAYKDSNKGYDFEIITLREQAEAINRYAEYGETVLVNEIQIKYWLREDIKIHSIDGLLNSWESPTLFLITDRDKIERGTQTLGVWDIQREGFIQWVKLSR